MLDTYVQVGYFRQWPDRERYDVVRSVTPVTVNGVEQHISGRTKSSLGFLRVQEHAR